MDQKNITSRLNRRHVFEIQVSSKDCIKRKIKQNYKTENMFQEFTAVTNCQLI